MRKYIYILTSIFILNTAYSSSAQTIGSNILDSATVENCVQYAMKNYPVLKESLVQEAITNSQIKSKLADWYPQVNLNGTLQHAFQLPQSIVSGVAKESGVANNSSLEFGLTQNIFDRDALLASQTQNVVRNAARQNTSATKIDVAVNVSKAFYDVLLTQQQILVLEEDIIRLKRSLKDALSQFNAGIVDNIDYKRATIALNNSQAQLRGAKELLKGKYATLKQLMGYPSSAQLELISDTSALERLAIIDTTVQVKYADRIEYQQLETQQQLQEANLKYQKWSYLPTVSAVANYNLNFMNSNFGRLYNQNYPNSFVGLQLGLPIFQGGKRTQNIRQAELGIDLIKLSKTDLENSVNSQYELALATYKGDLSNYYALKENVSLALDVYNTLSIQYRVGGIKVYLDVIDAETDLRSAQINFSNALYQLISDKLDVQKALGEIQF